MTLHKGKIQEMQINIENKERNILSHYNHPLFFYVVMTSSDAEAQDFLLSSSVFLQDMFIISFMINVIFIIWEERPIK